MPAVRPGGTARALRRALARVGVVLALVVSGSVLTATAALAWSAEVDGVLYCDGTVKLWAQNWSPEEDDFAEKVTATTKHDGKSYDLTWQVRDGFYDFAPFKAADVKDYSVDVKVVFYWGKKHEKTYDHVTVKPGRDCTNPTQSPTGSPTWPTTWPTSTYTPTGTPTTTHTPSESPTTDKPKPTYTKTHKPTEAPTTHTPTPTPTTTHTPTPTETATTPAVVVPSSKPSPAATHQAAPAKLPKTGGNTVAAVAGIAILAAGVGLVLATRRRRDSES